MTTDTLVAGGALGMAGVGEGIDDGGERASGHLAARGGVALHAERVVFDRKDGLVGMRIVAVETGDPGMAHAAGEDGCPVEVLVALLAVWMENAGLDGKYDAVVVVVVIAGFEGGGERFVACVAGGAGLHDARAVAGGGIVARRVGIGGRAMASGRIAVALDAADSLFQPGGIESVGRGVVTGFIPGHVARRAHGVPIHASTGPVTPFAGLAVLGAEDVEPVISFGIESEGVSLPATAARGDEGLPDWLVPKDHERAIGRGRAEVGRGGECAKCVLVGEIRQLIGERVVSAGPSRCGSCVAGGAVCGPERNLHGFRGGGVDRLWIRGASARYGAGDVQSD